MQDGVGRRSSGHRWTNAERTMLCIVRLWFQSSNDTDTDTYRAMRDLLRLRFASIPDRFTLQQISSEAVGTQCYRMMRGRNDVWDKVVSRSRQQLKSEIALLQKLIINNALDLVPRSSQFVPSPKTLASLQKRRKRRESSNDSDYEKIRKPRNMSTQPLHRLPVQLHNTTRIQSNYSNTPYRSSPKGKKTFTCS